MSHNTRFLFTSFVKTLIILALFVIFSAAPVMAAPPANDDFADAQTISGASGTVSGNNYDATEQIAAGEPEHYPSFPPQYSVWYQWTAGSNTQVSFTVQGNDYDVFMAVYEGGSIDTLTMKAGSNHVVSFTPTNGNTYYIAVDGEGFSTLYGDFTLEWNTSSSTNSISGLIELPGGTAPAGGVTVSVNAYDSVNYLLYYTAVTIPVGSNSALYSLILPSDNSVVHSLDYGYDDSSYYHTGYYSSTGTVISSYDATLLDGGQNHSGINLTLIRNYTITGSISLPAGITAPPGGVTISEIIADDNGWFSPSSGPITIQEGENSALYSITISPHSYNSYKVHYAYIGGDYYASGYYTSTETIWDEAEADSLSGGTDHSEIDVTLIGGNTITGSVALPAGATAPAEGISCEIDLINAESSGTMHFETVTMAAGDSSALYSISIPSDSSASFSVAYWCSVDDYLSSGYYAAAGTTWKNSEADSVPGGQDHSGINLTLLTGNTITGTIALPTGTAPAGGSRVYIYAKSNSRTYSTTVTINEGSSSAPYSIAAVLPDPSLTMTVYYSYYNIDDDTYIGKGYYTAAGTVWDQNAATPLTGGQNHTDINLTLLTGNTISGTIALPSGTAPAEGIQVYIGTLDSRNGAIINQEPIQIMGGSNSAAYSIPIPSDSAVSFAVRYRYSNWDGPYLRMGYHASAGTAWSEQRASQLTGGQDHSGINLTLLTGNTISGTVTLPSGTAPAGGTAVSIAVEGSENGNYVDIAIPTGSSSAPYSINKILPDTSTPLKVSYSYSGSDYLLAGYYSAAGTTWDSSESDLLSGGQDHSGINMTLLTGSVISGTISLPSGTAPAGGIDVNISYFSADGDEEIIAGFVSIAAGSSSMPYSITVPQNAPAGLHIAYKHLYGGNYLSTGYYSDSGTTWDPDAARSLPAGLSLSDINLTLLSGNTISGSIALPSGTTSGTVYLDVFVQGANNSALFQSYMSIATGDNAGSYSILVPSDASASWIIFYNIYDNTYVESAYYAPTGTTASENEAGILNGGQPLTGIDMTLLPAVNTYTITGTVSLTAGTTAPAGGISLTVVAQDMAAPVDEMKTVTVIIPEGSNSAAYTLSEFASNPSGTFYIYYLYDNNGVQISGIYSITGTVSDWLSATPLAGGQDYSGINLDFWITEARSFSWGMFLQIITNNRNDE